MAYTNEQRISKLEEKANQHEKRLSKLEDVQNSINDINLNLKELSLTQKQMLETMKSEQDIRKEHAKRLSDLETKPLRDSEKLKWIIITALASCIISVVVGWVIGRFLQ